MKAKLILSAIAASMVLSTAQAATLKPVNPNSTPALYEQTLAAVYGQSMAVRACAVSGYKFKNSDSYTMADLNQRYLNGLTARPGMPGHVVIPAMERQNRVWDMMDRLFKTPGSNEFAVAARKFIGTTSTQNYTMADKGINIWSVLAGLPTKATPRSWQQFLSNSSDPAQALVCENLEHVIAGVSSMFNEAQAQAQARAASGRR